MLIRAFVAAFIYFGHEFHENDDCTLDVIGLNYTSFEFRTSDLCGGANSLQRSKRGIHIAH